jgi:transcriptional regulator with XRE-family HTH domain
MPKKPDKNSAQEKEGGEDKMAVSVPEDGIGQRIKEARQRPENGLTVEALSRLCRELDVLGQGVTPTTLLRYEQGKVKPSTREIRILCRSLDVTADWLVLGQAESRRPAIDEAITLLRKLMEKEFAESNKGNVDVYEKFSRQEALKRAKAPPGKAEG